MVSNKHPERRFAKFKMAMVNEAGFRQSSCDHSLFVRYTAYGMVIFLVYVYNIKKAGIVKWEFSFFFHTFRNSSE